MRTGRRGFRPIELLIVLFIPTLLFPFLGSSVPLEILIALGGGWISWLARVPELAGRYPEWSLALLAGLLLLAVGIQVAARALGPSGPPPDGRWPWRWTLRGLGLLLLVGLTGIGLIGLVHELHWLARLEEPWQEERIRKRGLSRKIEEGLARMRPLAQEIERIHAVSGRLPPPEEIEFPPETGLLSLARAADGTLTLTYRPEFFLAPFSHPDITSLETAGRLLLQPRWPASGAVEWTCRGEFPAGFGPINFLPASCRK